MSPTIASASPLVVASTAPSEAAAPWVSDQGDGTYRNPVLYADYSDPDAIRVGDDYWMTSSSFNHVPGLPILHSRDLVNWTLVNHALPAQVPEKHFETPRHGEGVWAPAIRHHAGKFWIFYPDPDFGLYVITATDPLGAWSKPHLIVAGKGLIDPCPLWDDDGRAWLIHGWAKSRAGVKNRLTLHEMSPDGTRLLDEGKIVIDGDQMPGWTTIEGPKFYKRDGYYYIFAPAGGVATGYQAVFRARDIQGPYENRVVLEQGSTPVNGPHQGAWVETPAGEHWFFHFQEIEAYGRVVHLQPMRWRADGWPVMGDDADDNGTGEPVLRHAKPALPAQPVAVPATSDDFSAKTLGLQWQWQGNASAGWAELTDGSLRLRAVPARDDKSLWLETNLLMQKFPAPSFSAETTLSFSPRVEGERAGLVVFGYDYGWIGLRRGAKGVELVQASCTRADKAGEERVVAARPWTEDRPARLRASVDADAVVRFYVEGDDGWQPFGESFRALSSRWVGAKVGVFASAPAATKADATGHADFEAFAVTK